MQKTLSITVNKKKIVSKPFDFETMCIVNDAHNDENDAYTKYDTLNTALQTLNENYNNNKIIMQCVYTRWQLVY